MSCEPHRVYNTYALRHIIVITGNEERNRKNLDREGAIGSAKSGNARHISMNNRLLDVKRTIIMPRGIPVETK